MSIHVDGWAWLDTSAWELKDVLNLQDSLTLIPRQSDRDDQPPKPVYMYREDGELLGIPRMHSLVKRLSGGRFDLNVSDGSPINLAFDGTLRHDQPEAERVVLDLFRDKPFAGGILRARGGWGKTVWASHLIATMQRTALVIVNRSYLIRQWEQRLERFLPGIRIGRIQQGQCDHTGYDVAIASIDSMSSKTREYPESLYNWPGLVITDEVHIIGAQTWAPVVPLFNARYRIGLSATPRRWDGCAKVFFQHIGPVIYKSSTKTMQGKVRRVFTGWQVIKNDPLDNDPPDFVIERMMIASPVRNEQILDELVKAVDAKRTVLAFSTQRKHLEIMREAIEGVRPDVEASFFWGGQSEEEEAEAIQAQVIFLTYQKASSALDIEWADTEFLMMPRGDIEQAWYRILRELDDKLTPIAVDFIDLGVPFCKRRWKSRKRFYKKEGALQ